MKTVISKLTSIVFFVSLLVTACNKDVLDSKPGPGNTKEFGSLKFIVDTNLTAGNYHSNNLAALVTIVDDKGVEVIKNKVLALELDNRVLAENIQLPVGNYKLTSFKMIYNSANTVFVIPMAGSVKASLVQNPLAMDFKISKDGTGEVPLHIVLVKKGDNPLEFGYPSGAFGSNEVETSPNIKIKIRAAIKVGEILYDSIPANLSVRTYSSSGEMTFNHASIKAGTDELSLLKSAGRYEISFLRWGNTYSLTLNRNDLNEHTVYVIGGNKGAKKLKSEAFSILRDGKYTSISKVDYLYDAAGNVSQLKHFFRRADNTPYVAFRDEFEYIGGKVQKINRFDEFNNKIGLTTFSYDGQGRVIGMNKKENGAETNATAVYSGAGGQDVLVRYRYSNGTAEKINYMTFKGGNMISGLSDIVNNEQRNYNYDLQINPYLHLGEPNLFLWNISKNNVAAQHTPVIFDGSGTIEVADYSYTYDAEGYPKELIRKDKATNGHAFSNTKTVYVY